MKTSFLARSSKRQPAEEEESIYNIGAVAPGSAPRVQNLHVAPPAPQPKPKMHADSSQIESLLNPVRGPRDAQIRAGIKPTNHAQHNRTAIREASQMNALRKLQDDQEPPAKLGLQRNSSIGSAKGTKQRAPRRSDTSDSGRDFVFENKVQASAARALRHESQRDEGEYLAKRNYGKVPHYLVERKAEMVAMYEAEVAAKEAALIPPGMRMLPEEERQETLVMLAKNKDDVDKAIRALPFVIETPSQIRRQNELHARLKEIEEAVKIFSRAKVLVHV